MRGLRVASGLLILIGLASGLGAASPADSDASVLRAMSRAIATIAAQARPSVVSIYTTKTVRLRELEMPDFPFGPGSPFDDFFRRRAPRRDELKERQFRQSGLGSGFIINAEKGYIVTNHHVIDKADDIKVRLSDQREFDGKIVGHDQKTDIAVIQIKAENLKALSLGDSDKLTVGEFVIAIGSPFGLSETVTAGIVSAKGRSNLALEDYEDFIQTDAAINQGNSGGPLLNVDGKVVGVNTAILSQTGGYMGVGLAIPINLARPIIDQLIDTGKVVRGWLGVMIQDVTPDVAEKFGLERPEGALVSQVFDDTPAGKAGIKPGDVIITYDSEKVENVARLRARVAATAPGTKVNIVVLRDGKRQTLAVEIGTLTDEVVAAARGETTSAALGVSVQDLTPELAKTLGVKAANGVAVTSVDEGGPAARKGIKRGDVILEVDRKPVGTVAEFDAALHAADVKKGVLLLVVDARGSRFVVVKADERD